MLRIAICDDEMEFVSELKGLLKRYIEETGIELMAAEYRNGRELIENYDINTDLIFLDIQMNEMDGLTAAGKIRELDEDVSIIFLTSLKKYALEGYKYQAVNYMVKPVKYIRLKAEMNNWLRKYRQKNPYIVVRNDSGSFKMSVNKLYYAETYKRNLLLHTADGNVICYKNMKEIEKELFPHGFFRCHTGFLVNLAFVKNVEKLDVELTSGETVYVSKPKRKAFMEALAGYWGKML